MAQHTAFSKMPLRNVVAYVRASTDEQKLGPKAQANAIEAFCTSQGLVPVAFYIDQGVSGASPLDARKGLLEAMTHVRELKCDLVIAKQDRLARDVYIALTIERSMPKGCSILSADGTGNGNDPASQMLRTILQGMSQYERALIRERTKAALAALKRQGKRTGSIPYGFTIVEDNMLVPNPEEQAVIQRAKELFSTGISQRAVVRALDSIGIRGRGGKPMSLSQVQRFFS